MLLPKSNIDYASDLLVLISEGDEVAFTKLYNLYKDFVFNAALKISKSSSIAEEITGDVFVKIWLQKEKLLRIHNFNAYLFVITRNCVFKALKQIAKNYEVKSFTENDLSVSHNSGEDYLMNKEYCSIFQRAIDCLPRQQKEVYTLIKEEGFNRKETADLLKLQPETVKFHLAQAMKNIRLFCSPYMKVIIAFVYLQLLGR